jgi:hypothetical protein
MPQYVDTRERSAQEKYKRELISQDLLRCYQQIIKGESVVHLIRAHKKLINKLAVMGHHNKYPSVNILTHYKNTADKVYALSVFTNYLNNKRLFSKFLSEEAKTEKRWKSCGTGHTC